MELFLTYESKKSNLTAVIFSPSVILKNAIEGFLLLSYASGVAGIAAAVALVAGLITNYKIAVFGIILMLGLMTVLVVFSLVSLGPRLVIYRILHYCLHGLSLS